MRTTMPALGVLALLSALACSSSTTASDTVAGTYQASRLRFTEQGQATVDALAGGATITITLTNTGTTTGTFFVPGALNGGVPQSYDLSGTYLRTGAVLEFTHSADTFLRDVPWTIQGATLVTTASAGGGQYDVVLSRQ
jgi:hypothetical protein